MPINPHLFIATHPSLNATFHLFGVHHEMQYAELPPHGLELLSVADVVFHEGRNGLVFIEPFEHADMYLYNPNNPAHKEWLHRFTEKEKEILQKLVNHYFHKVKRQFSNIPQIAKIRWWVVDELILNFSYFARGGEIDHTLHWLRIQANKKIIDLDDEFLAKRLHKHMQALLSDCALEYIQKELAEIENFFSTGQFVFENKEEDELQDFSFIIDYANDFSRERPEYVLKRNSKWCEKFHAFFQTLTPRSHKKLGLVCGVVHLPDIMAYLISCGFTVEQVSLENKRAAIAQQTKDMLFAFAAERRTYLTLRAEILGKSENGAGWVQEVLLAQQKMLKPSIKMA